MNRLMIIFREILISDLIMRYLTLTALVITAIIYYFQLTTSSNQLTTLREQEDLQLRAYVGAESNELVGVRPDGKIGVAVVVKNFGQTPALNLALESIGTFQFPREGDVAANDNPSYPDQTRFGILFPQDTLRFNVGVGFDQSSFMQLKSGKQVFVFQSKIYYQTAFGNPVFTTVCYIFDQEDFEKAASEGSAPGGSEQIGGSSCSNGFSLT